MMKRLTNRIAMLVALVAVAGAVSCSKEHTADESQDDGIRLEFNAALDEGFGPAPSTMQGATSSAVQAATRGPILGVNFPEGTHLISLAIYKDDKDGTPWDTGYDNIKAEVTVNAYGTQKWRFQLKGRTTWMNYLSFPENTVGDMWITALYPYDAAATTNAFGSYLDSNFDFTTSEQQANQTDIMYSAPQKLTLVAGDRSRAFLLKFNHYLAMFEFQIAPLFDNPSRISKIVVADGNSKKQISNKFNLLSFGHSMINEYGEVAVTDTRLMAMGVYNTYRVMIRPASNDNDGDIVVIFTDDVNTSVAPLSLPIKREWLDGVAAGKRYIFKMLYHNASTGPGSLTVTDWAVGDPVDDMWGTPLPREGYICWDAPGLIKSGNFTTSPEPTHTIPNATTASYNGYVRTEPDAAGNGGYSSTEPLGELPYHRLEVAKADERIATWGVAWDICKEKAPAGQWRLPRFAELVLIRWNKTELVKTPDFTDFKTDNYYYTATEYSSGNVRYLSFETGNGYYGQMTANNYVRCVRELP